MHSAGRSLLYMQLPKHFLIANFNLLCHETAWLPQHFSWPECLPRSEPLHLILPATSHHQTPSCEFRPLAEPRLIVAKETRAPRLRLSLWVWNSRSSTCIHLWSGGRVPITGLSLVSWSPGAPRRQRFDSNSTVLLTISASTNRNSRGKDNLHAPRSTSVTGTHPAWERFFILWVTRSPLGSTVMPISFSKPSIIYDRASLYDVWPSTASTPFLEKEIVNSFRDGDFNSSLLLRGLPPEIRQD